MAVMLLMVLVCCIDSLFDYFAMRMGAGWLMASVMVLAAIWLIRDQRRFEKGENYEEQKKINRFRK